MGCGTRFIDRNMFALSHQGFYTSIEAVFRKNMAKGEILRNLNKMFSIVFFEPSICEDLINELYV
jgi:hypothetical protein